MLNNPREKKIQLDQGVQLFDQIDKGFIPGFGAAQIDTFPEEDNVDPGHPLNVDYYVANNFQRLLGARLSFKLRAYRTYATLVTTGAGNFVRFDTVTAVNAVSVNEIHTAFAVTGLNTAQHSHAGGALNTVPPNIIVDTALATQAFLQTSGVGLSIQQTVAYPPPLLSGLTSASNSLGVVEDLVATGVHVTIDGTDVTALLTPAGPYNADQVEIDLRPIMTTARITPSVFHTIALSSTQRGRIHAFLRLTYFVNGQIA
jgi:hypothetical protein